MKTEIEKNLQEKFDNACTRNNFSVVKHFIQSPGLLSKIDVKGKDLFNIKYIFELGFLELGDYIFANYPLSQEEKVICVSNAFAMACFRDNMDLIQTFFHDEKYHDLLDITFNQTWCFRTAYSNKRKEVLDFLIMNTDLTIDDADVQQNIYYTYPLKKDMIDYCEKLFAAKKLYQELPDKAEKTKMKI